MNFTRLKPYHFLLLILCLGVSYACNSQQKNQSDQGEGTEVREPTEDELREIGRVVAIEDGAYPMYSITIDFSRAQMQRSMGFNIEESELDAQGLMALKGKEVEIYYTSELEHTMVDMVVDCESILGESAPDQLEDGTKELFGILSGAESLSGDLPTEITITASDGGSVSLKEFVFDEMVQANGKEVTVYYITSGVDMITLLRELKD